MVRSKIVIDPAEISEDLLMRLADEITNPRSLSVLCLSCSPSVQRHAIYNPNTPLPMFNILCNSPTWEVRAAIAEQIRTPKTVLQKLTQDNNFEVRITAKRTLKKIHS